MPHRLFFSEKGHWIQSQQPTSFVHPLVSQLLPERVILIQEVLDDGILLPASAPAGAGKVCFLFVY